MICAVSLMKSKVPNYAKGELPEFLYIDGALDESRMRIIWERIGTLDFSKV